MTVIHSPPDAQSTPAPDIVQDSKAAAVRLLERLAQDTSQSGRKHESLAHIAHGVDETEQDKAAALADAIVSVVGAEHADKTQWMPVSFFLSYFFLYLVCVYTRHAAG